VSHSLVASFAYTIRSGGGGGGGGGSSSAAKPEDFTTQSGCEGADFYWYNGVCNLNPAPVVEDEDDEDLTETAERERERVRNLEEQLDGIEKNRGNMQTLRERAVMLLGIVQAKGEGYESAEQALLALIERIDAMEGRLSEELGEVEEELNKAKESASNYNQLERLETMRRNATTLLNAFANQEGRETQRTAIQTLLNTIEALKANIETQLENI
jgi:chromosome segregation ATPase